MTTIYTPGNKLELLGGHPDMDLSDYGTVEELLSLAHLDDVIEGEATEEFDPDITALAVLDDGRVFYHYRANREMAFSFDLLSSVGQPWLPVFERIIDDNGLNILTFETPGAPWIFDVALTEGAVVPGGYPNDLLRAKGVLA